MYLCFDVTTTKHHKLGEKWEACLLFEIGSYQPWIQNKEQRTMK